jgi:YtkA-like
MLSLENSTAKGPGCRVQDKGDGKARLELWLIRSYQLAMIFYLRIVTYLALALAVFFSLGDPCEAGNYRVRKNAEGLVFEITINRNPPVLGDNEIHIEIRDSEGNPVLDAEVLVNYYMPPMPKMAPMNYTIPAPLSGKEYRAVMDLIMTGPWNVITRARVQGKWIRVTFPIDVR